MDEFADKAIQPCYDPWPSLDFHDNSKINVDLTKAYKNERLASNVQTIVEVSVSPKNPNELAPQRRQPAQRPRIDVSKTSRAAAVEALAVKLHSSCPGASGDCS